MWCLTISAIVVRAFRALLLLVVVVVLE